MTKQADEFDSHEFDDDKIDDLYRFGAREQPSKQLTRTILEAASKQAHENQSGTYLLEYFLQLITSSKSLAFAAVLVIGISIILQIQFDKPGSIVPEFKSETGHDVKQQKMEAPVDSIMEDTTPAVTTEPQMQEESSAVAPTTLNPPSVKSEPGSKQVPEKKSARISSDSLKHEQLINQPPSNQQLNNVQLENKQLKKELRKDLLSKEKARRELQRRQKQESEQTKKREAESSGLISRSSSSYLAAPTASIEKTQDSLSKTECSKLSIINCLSSENCIADYVNGKQLCRQPENSCEENFVQALNLPDSCQPADQCRFIAGNCSCDTINHCLCVDNTLPRCVPISPAQ